MSITPRVIHGECVPALADLEPGSVSAVVTDPPYGLAPSMKVQRLLAHWLTRQEYRTDGGGFMGAEWDQLPGPATWAAIRRTMAPGAHLVAFAAPRTMDLMTIALRLAGFEIRDTLMWVFGQGFPKGLDVAKAIDRRREDRAELLEVTAWVRRMRDARGLTNADIDAAFGTHGMAAHWCAPRSQPAVPTIDQVPRLLQVLGVKPERVPDRIAHLIWTLNGRKGQPGDAWMRRPITGEYDKPAPAQGAVNTYAAKGAAASIGERRDQAATDEAARWEGWNTTLKPAWEPIILAQNPMAGPVAEQVLATGTGALNVGACKIEAHGRPKIENLEGGASVTCYGDGLSGSRSAGVTDEGRWPANVVMDEAAGAMLDEQAGELTSGARKAGEYRALATGSIYGEGSHGPMPALPGDTGGPSRFFYCPKARKAERGAYNLHPTVKPIALMRWLTRLVTPPGGLVLDPFAGSGSTLIAARAEGFPSVGIEADAAHVDIIHRRLADTATLEDTADAA